MSDPDLVDDRATGGMGWAGDLARTWLPAIFAVLVIRTFVFEPFRIPSGSMVPTLLIGDQVVVNKASYGLWVPNSLVEVPFTEHLWTPDRHELFNWGDPQRGDIIVFRFPRNPSLNYIKRVVAIPGDKIRVDNNQVFINGVAQEQEYVGNFTFTDDRCRSQPMKRYVETMGDEQHYVLKNTGFPGRLEKYPRRGGETTIPEGNVFVMGDNRDNSEDSREWLFVEYNQIKGKAHFVWFSWDACNGQPAGKIRGSRLFRGLYKLHQD